MIDIEYCASENKSEALCNCCIRNIDLADIHPNMEFNEFKIVKNLKTKEQKCSGFIQESKIKKNKKWGNYYEL